MNPSIDIHGEFTTNITYKKLNFDVEYDVIKKDIDQTSEFDKFQRMTNCNEFDFIDHVDEPSIEVRIVRVTSEGDEVVMTSHELVAISQIVSEKHK